MKKLAIAAALGGCLALGTAPAYAYYHHHHHHGGGAAIAGFAAGAILGGALASQPYYYGPPAYAYEPGYGPSVAWCERHYRSYDPRTGTYLGYDGYRHPCP
jgi:BA14K-like protein